MFTARSSYAIEQRLPDRYSGSPSHQPTDNAHTTSLALALALWLWLSLALSSSRGQNDQGRGASACERISRAQQREAARSYKCTPSPKNDRWSPSVERTKIPSLSQLSLTVEPLFRTPYIYYTDWNCACQK